MYWFLLKSIVSAVLGSQFYKWYASTKIGIYFQNRIDQFMEYVSKKYDITLMRKELKFKRDYPLVMERLERLEDVAHPFDGAYVTEAAVNKTKDLYNLEGLEERVSHLEHKQDPAMYNKLSTKLGRLGHELKDDGKV